MNLWLEWANDWVSPYPFRVAVLESNHDEPLGQWELTLAILGLSVTLVWEYADTPLKTDLRDMLADDKWLEGSHVYMPHADYQAMKDKADAYDKLQAGGQ